MTRRGWVQGALAAALMLGTAATAAAQDAARPAPVVEGAVGWAGFGDEGIVHHTLFGAGARVYLSPRFSIGPEVQYMVGPGSDRDLILTGNVMVDVLAPTAGKPRRTTPYVVVGGGLFRHTQQFFSGTATSTEGAFTAGVGLRTWLNDRVFAAVDGRIGWEPHLRLAGTIGVALR